MSSDAIAGFPWPRARRGKSLLIGGLAALAAALVLALQARPHPVPRRVEVLVPSVPRDIDPYRDGTVSARAVFLAVFEPLVRVETDGRLAPALAEAWMSPGPHVATFRLRPGIRFQDGRPLDAQGVARALEEARRSPLYAAALAEVTAVEVTAPLGLTVRTRRSTAGLVYALTGVPIARRSGDGGWVGTGPYRVVDRGTDRVELSRYAGYRGPAPFLQGAVFRVTQSSEQTVRLAQRHDAAVVLSPSREAARTLRGDPRYAVMSYPTSSLYFLGYDLTRPGSPFRDLRVRRALRLGLDAQRLIEEATPAGGVAATQFLPPGALGHDATLAAPCRDVVAARRLLAEAGHARGLSVTLDASPVYEALGRAVAVQLKELGVDLRLQIHSPSDLRERVEAGSTLFVYNWIFGKGSGLTLAGFLHTRQPARGWGLRNAFGYSNPRVDAWLEAALDEPTAERRGHDLRQAMPLVMEDLPGIPLYSAHGTRVYPRGLVFPVGVDGLLRLAEARPAHEGAVRRAGGR